MRRTTQKTNVNLRSATFVHRRQRVHTPGTLGYAIDVLYSRYLAFASNYELSACESSRRLRALLLLYTLFLRRANSCFLRAGLGHLPARAHQNPERRPVGWAAGSLRWFKDNLGVRSSNIDAPDAIV